MTNYRRSIVSGASYFFTVNLADRSSTLLTDQIDLLRTSFAYVQKHHPFTIDAIVVLPDHLHCIWTLPDGDSNFSTRWRLIKTVFSRGVPIGENRSVSRQSKGERGIWQRQYWEHLIRDDLDYARHVDYIHINPVKHGWVNQVSEWEYSSFQHYVRAGILPIDWAGDMAEEIECGERKPVD